MPEEEASKAATTAAVIKRPAFLICTDSLYIKIDLMFYFCPFLAASHALIHLWCYLLGLSFGEYFFSGITWQPIIAQKANDTC
jgi:hypothetical protein